MTDKRKLDEVNLEESKDAEDYIMRERGFWDAQMAGWQGKRDEVRAEMERHALEKLLSSQSAEQVKELQDPQQAQQWLQLMESSLRPFLNDMNRTVTSSEPLDSQNSPPRKRLVPTEPEYRENESRSGLWTTLPKTTQEFVEARRQSLTRPDWSNAFNNGVLGAQGEPQDRYWEPSLDASRVFFFDPFFFLHTKCVKKPDKKKANI